MPLERTKNVFGYKEEKNNEWLGKGIVREDFKGLSGWNIHPWGQRNMEWWDLGSDETCVRTSRGVNLSKQIRIDKAEEYRMGSMEWYLLGEFPGPILHLTAVGENHSWRLLWPHGLQNQSNSCLNSYCLCDFKQVIQLLDPPFVQLQKEYNDTFQQCCKEYMKLVVRGYQPNAWHTVGAK